jgi:hypothetical protein
MRVTIHHTPVVDEVTAHNQLKGRLELWPMQLLRSMLTHLPIEACKAAHIPLLLLLPAKLLLTQPLQCIHICSLPPAQRQHQCSLCVQDAAVVLHIALQVRQHVWYVCDQGPIYCTCC